MIRVEILILKYLDTKVLFLSIKGFTEGKIFLDT